MSDIIFNIASGKLTGIVGDYTFEINAFSGGRGGSKTKGAIHPAIVNNPLLTHMKLQGHGDFDFAGALPMGLYTLKNHESKPNWIRLVPNKENYMSNRDGFAIHGRGPRGSDGCIVPNDFSIVNKLYNLTKKYSDAGREITLEVKAVGDIDYFERLIKEYNSIG